MVVPRLGNRAQEQTKQQWIKVLMQRWTTGDLGVTVTEERKKALPGCFALHVISGVWLTMKRWDKWQRVV